MGSEVKIKSNNWSNLFKSITALKKITLYIMGDVNNSKIEIKDSYFKGEAERYIFCLLELDGKQRMEKLGVNKTHYSNKEVVDKWRNKIAKTIHPDVCNHIYAEKAIAELNEMYKEEILWISCYYQLVMIMKLLRSLVDKVNAKDAEDTVKVAILAVKVVQEALCSVNHY